ncbi:MAG: hypothetical protein Ct9H300mP19_16670 [Dehalococcoidia bacterium]|nr:MAG: hypothetical protein Ct9H300mP19_16670 [Dehalococcoidia bacterium]
MPVPIILPQWGMGMNDGEIIKWLKAVGDPVANGDQLVEIESAKVNAEVESTADGTLGRIDVEAGRIVDVGTVLGYVLEAGDSESDLPDVAPVVGSASTLHQLLPLNRPLRPLRLLQLRKAANRLSPLEHVDWLKKSELI